MTKRCTDCNKLIVGSGVYLCDNCADNVLMPEDIALAEEVLSRPPVELTDDVLKRMAEREVEIGCEIDRMTQHFPPAEGSDRSDK
jgi:hypothetical protein